MKYVGYHVFTDDHIACCPGSTKCEDWLDDQFENGWPDDDDNIADDDEYYFAGMEEADDDEEYMGGIDMGDVYNDYDHLDDDEFMDDDDDEIDEEQEF